MDATPNSLDDAILPSKLGFLQLQDGREELKTATVLVTHLDICSFLERVGKAFITLTDNISSRFRFSSKDVLSVDMGFLCHFVQQKMC